MTSNQVLFADLLNWVEPVWMIYMGVAIGLIILEGVFGVLRATLPKAAGLVKELALDGMLQPLFFAALVPAAIALLLAPWAPLPKLWGADKGAFVTPDNAPALGAAALVLGLFVLALAMRLLLPKLSAIATTTMKEGLAQPLFWVCLAFGGFLLLVFIWLPYNTFGEDIKMLKDSGLTLIMVMSIILAVATASVSIADEIEGRTALTLLSKPIGRTQFIVGKFLGILGPVVVLFFALGLFFLATVSYKVVYDGAEGGRIDLTAADCRYEVLQTIPGLALAFMETVVLAAISVAISTRLPMLANLTICFSIYVLGHLVPLLVQSSVGKFEIVTFIGTLLATVLPVLDHFNMTASISGGQPVPLEYLWTAAVYCVLYSTFALLGALVLFEDRDLA